MVAVCGRCGEGMCDACWLYVAGDAPWCSYCVGDVTRAPRRAWSLVTATGLAVCALLFFASRHASVSIAVGAAIGAALTALAVILVVLQRARAAARAAPSVRERERDDELVVDPLAPPASPFRVALVRVSSRALPRLSATATAAAAVVSLVATALLVPAALRLPRWLEAEIVLGTWWAMGVVALAALLFRGTRLADDYVYRLPWHRPAEQRPPAAPSSTRSPGTSADWLDPTGCSDMEGCAGALVGVLLAAAAFAAAWLVVELVAPIVFLLFYGLLIRAVARATQGSHGCKGHVMRSLAWGALWASAYAAPVVVFVWLLHATMRARGIGGM